MIQIYILDRLYCRDIDYRMKIYKTQQEVEKDIVGGVLAVDGDVKFECSIYFARNYIFILK